MTEEDGGGRRPSERKEVASLKEEMVEEIDERLWEELMERDGVTTKGREGG